MITEAREAFSNPIKEHLYNVKRVRDKNGNTISISGGTRFIKPLTEKDVISYRRGVQIRECSLADICIDHFKLDILPDIKRKWGEWVGELTRYSDSAGSIWVENKVPKETGLRKVLKVLRRVK